LIDIDQQKELGVNPLTESDLASKRTVGTYQRSPFTDTFRAAFVSSRGCLIDNDSERLNGANLFVVLYHNILNEIPDGWKYFPNNSIGAM
jgi:hypothetical protein